MKRFLLLFVLIFGSVAFAEAPEFSEQPGAVIKEVAQIANAKRIKDRVRLVSYTEKENIKLKIYFYNEKEEKWMLYGIGNLKEFGDTDFIESPYEGKFRGINYIAILPPEGSNFVFSYKETNHDLYINVSDE